MRRRLKHEGGSADAASNNNNSNVDDDDENIEGESPAHARHRNKTGTLLSWWSRPLGMLPPTVHTQRVIPLVLVSNVAVGNLVWWFTSSSNISFLGPRFGSRIVSQSMDGGMAKILEKRTHRTVRSPLDLLSEPSDPVKVTPVPKESVKTFYYDGWKISMPIVRALRSRGWQRVDEAKDAHIVYTYKQWEDMGPDMKPWQRFNLIPNSDRWNDKWHFVDNYVRWLGQKPGWHKLSPYIPESYMLTSNQEDAEAFEERLKEDGGAKYPWVMKEGDVNQGKGITILAPDSPELFDVASKALNEEFEDESSRIVQRYVCNEMTWNRRKFDVRVFWLVASLDPLIVLYHDGYVRIGNSDYTEEDFSNTIAHLTTHNQLGAEGKASFAQFENALQELATKKKQRFPAGSRAVDHVRNQMKDSLAQMIKIFTRRAFVKVPEELPTDNSFSFFCADYILDNDFDVWFLEPQYGCGLDEDYYFRLEMHASLFNGMVDILEEIWRKQEEGTHKILPLEGTGNWEVIYADGLVYSYDGYERSKDKASCLTTHSAGKEEGYIPKP